MLIQFEYLINPRSKFASTYYRWCKLLNLWFVIFFLLIGLYLILREAILQKNSFRALATVSGYHVNERVGSKGVYKSYLAKFKFTHINGQLLEVSNQWETRNPQWPVGSKVPVLYDPTDEKAYRIDDFYHTYGLGVLLIIGSLFFFCFSKVIFWIVDSRGLIG